MFLLESYPIAVLFCVITMLCWGSWGNTQKAAGKTWRFELFYWDYVLGVLLMSLIFAFTLGSHGEWGRGFCADLSQASPQSLGWAFAGGVVFNIANIMLVAAIAIAGMSVAFPVGIGLALVLGVILNYLADQSGNAALLFGGVALVTVAILLNARAYGQLPQDEENSGGASKKKGLILAILCGVLMSLFYYFVASSLAKVEVSGTLLDLTAANMQKDGAILQAGKLTPYTANVIFALGVFVSSFLVLPFLMAKPVVGTPVALSEYFRGSCQEHAWGIVGGCIWAVGMSLNVIAAGVASPAVSYGLGQGATLIAAIWGVFIWREFKAAPQSTGKILAAMFLCFLIGLTLIIWTKL